MPAQRILFIDDSPERQRRFKMNRIGCNITQAFTYAEALASLEENVSFDIVYLDHDLSEKAAALVAAGEEPDLFEKTGTDIAKFIVAMPPEKRPRHIVLHTHNFAGRMRMAGLLRDAGFSVSIAPFTA